jgi:hypothetical protein
METTLVMIGDVGENPDINEYFISAESLQHGNGLRLSFPDRAANSFNP